MLSCKVVHESTYTPRGCGLTELTGFKIFTPTDMSSGMDGCHARPTMPQLIKAGIQSNKIERRAENEGDRVMANIQGNGLDGRARAQAWLAWKTWVENRAADFIIVLVRRAVRSLPPALSRLFCDEHGTPRLSGTLQYHNHIQLN